MKDLAVSPKKLRVVANLARGLYWREAMLQLEFCNKNIAVMVKNAIAQAVRHGEEEADLDPTRAVVAVAAVGKGTYRRELDYKSKGRAGVRFKYQSHLYVIVEERSAEEVSRTRYYNRWRRTASMLDVPWHERVAALPRYKPIDGYDPGEVRVKPVLAMSAAELREADASGRHRRRRRGRRASASVRSPSLPA